MQKPPKDSIAPGAPSRRSLLTGALYGVPAMAVGVTEAGATGPAPELEGAHDAAPARRATRTPDSCTPRRTWPR